MAVLVKIVVVCSGPTVKENEREKLTESEVNSDVCNVIDYLKSILFLV